METKTNIFFKPIIPIQVWNKDYEETNLSPAPSSKDIYNKPNSPKIQKSLNIPKNDLCYKNESNTFSFSSNNPLIYRENKNIEKEIKYNISMNINKLQKYNNNWQNQYLIISGKNNIDSIKKEFEYYKGNIFLERKINRSTFKIINFNYEKSGHNIKKNSKRHQNCKQKIIRNFIQDILPNWINYGKEGKILKKICKKKLLYNYINYKCKKLKEIYEICEKDIFNASEYNNNITNKLEENIMIKLNFYFEEAFKAFCYENLRGNILLKVKNREFNYYEGENNEKSNGEEFFIKFKSKKQYINERINDKKDIDLFHESFNELLCELDISDN